MFSVNQTRLNRLNHSIKYNLHYFEGIVVEFPIEFHL